MKLKYVKIYGDESGGTHFSDIEVLMEYADCAPPSPLIDVAAHQSATGMLSSSFHGWVHGILQVVRWKIRCASLVAWDLTQTCRGCAKCHSGSCSANRRAEAKNNSNAYSMREIGGYVGLHCSAISRIIGQAKTARSKTWPRYAAAQVVKWKRPQLGYISPR